MQMLYRLSYVGGEATRGVSPNAIEGWCPSQIASPVGANEVNERRKTRSAFPSRMQEGRGLLRTENGIRRRTCSQQEICGSRERRARGRLERLILDPKGPETVHPAPTARVLGKIQAEMTWIFGQVSIL